MTLDARKAETEDGNSMNAVRNYQKELDKVINRISGKTGGRTADEDQIQPPRLFLHSCCAPCSSYVLEYLRAYFRITVFYYNPNISIQEEYRKRAAEQKRLIMAYNAEAERQEQAGAYSAGTGRQEQTGVYSAGTGRQEQTGVYSAETKQREQTGVHNAEAGETDAGHRVYPIEIVEGDYEPERFLEMAKGQEQCPEGGARCFDCYEMRLRKTAELALSGGYDYFTTTLSISPLKNAAKLNEIGERLAEEYGVDWLPSDFKKRGGYQRSIVLSKEYDLYRQDYCGCIYSRRQREQEERSAT